jgi:hypothetical protein
MTLSLTQKSQIRRHLRYPNIGFASVSATGGGGSLGTNESIYASSYFGVLEYRMRNLLPCDEAALTGAAYGSIEVVGIPAVGDTVVLSFSNEATGGPLAENVELTVTATKNEAGSACNFALAIAVKIGQTQSLLSAGFRAFQADSTVGIINSNLFQVTAIGTGQTGVVVDENGSSFPEPSVQVAKTAGVPVVMYGLLPILNYLFGAIGTATTRQGTLQADVFKARQDEVEARRDLYEYYQKRLSDFMDVPINPQARSSSGYGQIIY